MKLLSVIIPMYNVEHYVEWCIRNLEDQDLEKDEYEIICINDGSPDNSREIVKKLQYEFKNIILIDQINQGVSRARNNGINLASGKYILFIDPDDYVIPNSLKGVIGRAENWHAQVSFLGYTVYGMDMSIVRSVFNNEHSGKTYSGIQAYYLARGDGKTDPDRMWAILFKTDFLNSHNLRFLPDVPYLEDGEMIARILCLANRCIFDGREFYKRTTRPGSATHSDLYHSSKAVNGFIMAAKSLSSFQNENKLSPEQKYFINQPISKFVFLSLNSAIRRPVLKNYLWVRKELTKSGFGKIELKGVVKPYIYYSRLYNTIPISYCLKAYYYEFKRATKSVIKHKEADRVAFNAFN